MINSKSLIPVRIGALLISAEILKAKDLVEALKQARIARVPLGEILVDSHLVGQDVLNCALEVQKMLRHGVITVEIAQLALKMSATNDLPLAESLKVLGWQPECFSHVNATKLERLLLVSEVVNKQQLDQAIWNSNKSGLPLGRILVFMGITSPSTLLSALHALLLIRHNRITFEDAVEGMKYVLSTGVSLEEALSIESSEIIQLGELLTRSSVVSTSDVAHAIEIGLANQQPMVHVLVGSGLATEEIVEAAMKLQRKIRQGGLSVLQASEMLRRADSQNISVDVLIAKSNAMKEAVVALLKKAQIISESELTEIMEENPNYQSDKIEALCDSGAVSEGHVRSALRAALCMFDGNLNINQAVEAIKSYHDKTNKNKVPAQQSENIDVNPNAAVQETDMLLEQSA